jgi:hypothetical protein
MASTSGHALDSKEICEQLHNDLDSFSEIRQDAEVDIIEHSDPVAKVSGPDYTHVYCCYADAFHINESCTDIYSISEHQNFVLLTTILHPLPQ